MNRQFPALRGFAIFLVVLNHSIVLSLKAISFYKLPRVSIWETNILLTIKEVGVLAVPIFLFLAGSFMMYSLMNQTIAKGYRLILPALKNALIPYFIWSIIFFIIRLFLGHERFSFLGYLKNLIVGYPYNFVPILIFFIVISPLLAYIIKKYAILVLIGFGIYQFMLVIIQLPDVFKLSLPTWMKILSPPVLSLPLTLWAIFYPLGMIYIQHSQNLKKYVGKILPLSITLSIISFGVAILHELGYISFPLAEWFFPIAVVWIFPFVDRKKIPLLSFFEKLGKRSYGLYFMNLIIINLLIFITAKLTSFLYSVETLVVILFSFITIFVSLKFMEWIEKGPAKKLYRYLFG
jgi:hypothetical protein